MAAFIDEITTTNVASNSKTLCDWVKNFRMKKIQMKRKLRSNSEQLRVCAILTMALNSAEHELRAKQQKRFNKWIEMQSKLDNNNNNNSYNNERNNNNYHFSIINNNNNNNNNDEESQRRQDEITNLWKYELSGLDEFMKTISSSYK